MTRTPIGWSLLAGGAVATLVGLATSLPLLLLTGLAGLVLGVWEFVNSRARGRSAERHRQREWARTERDIARIGAAVTDLYALARTAATDAVVSRAAIQSLLAPTPTGTDPTG